jgi:hypothetical protein
MERWIRVDRCLLWIRILGEDEAGVETLIIVVPSDRNTVPAIGLQCIRVRRAAISLEDLKMEVKGRVQ